MRLLFRRQIIAQDILLLLFITLILVASPVLSRPAPEESNSDTTELSSSGLKSIEKKSSLEDVVLKSDSGPSKKPAKRSQVSASASAQGVFGSSNLTPESVSLGPQIPDPDKKGSVVQGLLLNILHPKPIVDTIREEDKYGNTGDKFAVIGRGVVAGAEGASQVLLKVLDFPFEAVKKVSRSATEALNNLGSKLIGL